MKIISNLVDNLNSELLPTASIIANPDHSKITVSNNMSHMILLGHFSRIAFMQIFNSVKT